MTTFAFASGPQPGSWMPLLPAAKSAERPVTESFAGSAAVLSLPALEAPLSARDLAANQVGVSRRPAVDSLPAVDQDALDWQVDSQGARAWIRTRSPGAAATRVGLRFDALPEDLGIAVAEISADGTLRTVASTTAADLAKLARGLWPLEHWTASTAGADQVIELRAARVPSRASLRLRVFDLSHLVVGATDPVAPKALEFTCHVDVACVADADVRTDAKAIARMLFVDGGRSFLCTGSLLNDRAASHTPLFATANHCIHSQASAASLETWWFYYPVACGAAPEAPVRLTGGATLLFADLDTDFALLRLAANAPAGAFFLGWDPAPLVAGQPLFGLHHPDGSFQRYSSGTYAAPARIRDSDSGVVFANPFSRVSYTRGIVEGGSSGSPLLTAPGSFRGTLFGSPDANVCSAPANTAYYSDFSAIHPMIAGFLEGPNALDDHGDSPAAATAIGADTRLVARIGSVTDQDWFRVTFPTAGTWTVSSFDAAPGLTVDVRAEAYAADGRTVLAANDDRAPGDGNFSLSVNVAAGAVGFLRVAGAPGVTGAYGLRAVLVPPDDYGDLPAAAAPLPANGEASGRLGSATDRDWFRITLDAPGSFHVASRGTTDTIGRLYRADGTTLVAENDDENPPDTNFGILATLDAPATLYLQVTGWEGSTGPYGLATTFTPAAGSNYTDLWGDPAEPGWGLTLDHQDDTLFAALFTYAADGRDLWLFASSLPRQPDGAFAGPLFRSTGPAFNASPWGAINLTQVGTMRVAFASDGQGTLTYSVNGVGVTKSIRRNRFGASVTCTATSASRAGATNFQDLWWNPAERGWGLDLAQQGDTIFAALFTYAQDGRDLWLFASGLAKQANGGFSGALYRASGSAFDASPWIAPTITAVGTMTLAFASGTSGSVSYTMNGVAVTKSIERQVFGSRAPLCR